MFTESQLNRLTEIPALSVKQPWASYLVTGLKSIELRTWMTRYRGWVWVHTGRKRDNRSMKALDLPPGEFPCGGLVGLMKIDTYHVIDSDAAWNQLRLDHMSPGYYAKRCYGWEIAEALSLRELIECPGSRGLFRLPRDVFHAFKSLGSDHEAEELLDIISDLESSDGTNPRGHVA